MSKNMKHELKCDEMASMAESLLPLRSWNFQQSTRIVTPYASVIYNSEMCRVKFIWGGWDMYTGDTISIYYGRLHAPDNTLKMIWKNEECHCWHNIKLVINFLDEITPQEAVDQVYVHGQWPRIMENFRQSDIGRSLSNKQPEWLIRMHAVAWEHYGKRLFELFDLQHPDIWEEYTHFIQAYYKVKGLIPEITPAQNKIC